MTDDIWLKKMEGICYFESDPHLSQELILDFGKRLRTAFYKSLSTFAEALDLIDEEQFYEMHADFCSRLAMTFSQGDYANNEAIKGKAEAAETLFNKALLYAPDHRAYLGLGRYRWILLELILLRSLCQSNLVSIIQWVGSTVILMVQPLCPAYTLLGSVLA